MKILFEGVDFSSPYRNGPTVFARRLALQFLGMGHVIADQDDHDVVLTFIEPFFKDYNKPQVLRLDGIWFKDIFEFRTKNVGIKNCYECADHVVFQSDFDKNMITHWWGKPAAYTVINNGIAIDPLKDHSALAPEIAEIRAKHEKVFCCSANWHGQKRLKKNIELFRRLKTFYPNSCLIVMGSNPEQISGSDIYYTGSLPHEISNQVLAISDWMIHLAYLDHSPNSVVEALMQNTPVICSSSGGTKELVGDFGIVIPEKKEYQFELTDYELPPDIDLSFISQPLPEKETLGNHADVNILNVANKYIKVFEGLV